MADEKISAMSSITNSGSLQVAVIDPGNPGVNSRTTLPGPGGSGSYTAGNGISLAGGTIANTGTIIQPSTTSETNLGVYIAAGDVINAGTSTETPVFGGYGIVRSGNSTITDPAGQGAGGGLLVCAGNAIHGTATGIGAGVNLHPGTVSAGVAQGGRGFFYGGAGNTSGDAILMSYPAHRGGTNGNVILDPIYGGAASGSTGGHVIINNIDTVDPGTVAAGIPIWTNNGVLMQAGVSNFTGTIDTASLVGKTITVVNGIITGFA